MHASDTKLMKLLGGDKQFLIPIFQRTYSWKESNCNKLFNDIRFAGQAADHFHFIGSIVTIPDEHSISSFNKVQVIDGQQRLTTVTLLITALVNKAEELGIAEFGDESLAEIREYNLINRNKENKDTWSRIKLTKGDDPALLTLLKNERIPTDSNENVFTNYQIFYDLLTSKKVVEEVFRGLYKLKIVDVTLNSGDDPQAIFESLNSTGVDLTQADLVRNYVLMQQKHDEQTKLYDKYWFPMEGYFKNFPPAKFDRFAQDFLTINLKSSSLIKSAIVYPKFKEWYQEQILSEKNPDELLSLMHNSAKYYSAFSLLTEEDPDLKDAFNSLRSLIEVASSVIIVLYSCHESGTLGKSEFIQLIGLLESYIIRIYVCDLQTRSLGNTFASMAQKIDPNKPFESLTVALASLKRNSRFPNDAEFKHALFNKDLYETRYCKFVLDKLENFGSKERVITEGLTIEHVLPQNNNLKSEWQAMLGENWEEIQQLMVHRIGNLTLTGYNSEYSDSTFTNKKTMEHGFDTSPFRLNKEMKASDVWTEEQINSRGERLCDLALNAWPGLDVDEKLVAEYRVAEKARLNSSLTIEDVKGINSHNKPFADLLIHYTKELCPEATIVMTNKNVTAYGPEPFFQMVGRSRKIVAIFDFDYDSLDPEEQKMLMDTDEKSFISNASLSGVFAHVKTLEEADALKEMIVEAYKL